MYSFRLINKYSGLVQNRPPQRSPYRHRKVSMKTHLKISFCCFGLN